MALDYVADIRADTVALVDAAATAGLDARVPACPDWDVGDLLEHIGRVHRWAAMSCEREPGGPFIRSADSGIVVPPRDERPEWVRAGGSLLADTIAALDPDRPAWTWAPPGTVAFWARRQAHETAVHRVDAQLAAGDPQPIDAELAADGIDELLVLVATGRPWAEPPTGDGETLHLHCTDTDGEFLARLAPSGLEVTREHAKGDVAVRGPASALLCWLHGRGPIEPLEVHGDEALLARWREIATF